MNFKDLLELYKQGKYQDVIDNADFMSDYNTLFLVLRSYLSLGLHSEALNFYQTNRETLEKYNLIESTKIYLFLLVSLNFNKSKIKDAIEYFQDKGYVNQETEEFLSKLDDYVDSLFKEEDTGDISIDELIDMLASSSPSHVAIALNQAVSNPKYSAINLPIAISQILKEKNEIDYASSMLLDYLIYADYNDTFLLRKQSNYYRINPHDLVEDKNKQNHFLEEAIIYINANEKDVTILNKVIALINGGSYILIPNYLTNENATNAYIAACYYLIRQSLDIEDYDDVFAHFLNNCDMELARYYANILELVK